MASDFLLQAIAGFTQGFARGFVPTVQTRLESELRRKESEERLRQMEELEKIPVRNLPEEIQELIPDIGLPPEPTPSLQVGKGARLEISPGAKFTIGERELAEPVVTGEQRGLERKVKPEKVKPEVVRTALEVFKDIGRRQTTLQKLEQEKEKEVLKASFKNEDDRIFEMAFRFVKETNPFFSFENRQKQIELVRDAIELVKMLIKQAKQPLREVKPKSVKKYNTPEEVGKAFRNGLLSEIEARKILKEQFGIE